jgi:transposase
VAIDLAALPDDVETLHRMIGDLATALDSERVRAQAAIDRLWEIVKALQRGRFGRRSERLDDGQLQLGLEDLDADIARFETSALPGHDRTNRASPSPADRVALPDHLPRAEMTVDIAPAACPCCGGAVHEIGETISEMLDYVPARLRVLRIRRPKYGCRTCGTIHQAPAPERPIAKGRASASLLAHVLVSKYCDHLPLYRQSQIFARQGVMLNRSTLANWVGGASWWLEALRERLAAHIFASGKLFADDTPVPVLDPGRGRTRTGRLWVYVRDDRPWAGPDPPAAVYFYSPDRRAERPAAHLTKFRGVLQVDGYPGFETLTAGEILLAACWAHTRRKFYDLHQATGSPIAAEALRRIAGLYAIETEIRGHSANERQLHRERHARPVIEALKPWLEHPAGAAAQRPRRSDPLCPRTLAGAVPVPRGRSHRARQQSGRARHPARGSGAQEPPLRRVGRRRRPLGSGRFAARDREAQWGRAVHLSQRCPRAHDQRPSYAPDR